MSRAFEESVLKNLHRIENQDLTQYLRRIFEEKYFHLAVMDSLYFSLVALDDEDRIVYHNRFASLFLNQSKASLIGEKILDICKIPELKLALAKLLSGQDTTEYMEINAFDKTSKDFLVSLSYFELKSPVTAKTENPNSSSTSKNKKKYQVVIVSDITDWKNKNLAEDQRKSIDSLHTLTAGIAHEIKNPLAAIDLHLQLIKRYIHDHKLGKEEKLTRWVGVVSEEIKRLESIVNDFLFSFRPSMPDKTPQNLNDILVEVVEFFEPQCREKKITIETDFDASMTSFLFDKNQLKQALINLIYNSIEAIEENPKIEGAGTIRLVTKENQDNIDLILTDNGVGIPTHKVTEIFKPFYTSKKMGTGLGLSIVTKIIKEHNGEIILNTDFKSGTQFFLEFSRLPTMHKIKQIPYQQ